MKRQFLTMALVAICAVAYLGQSVQADILADGGNLVTHPGGMTAPAGADRSAISPGSTTFGGGAQNAPNRVGDDFILAAPVNTINSMTFFMYQTGATAPSMTGVFVEIWNGAPNAGGSVIWGDTTTNVMSSNSWWSGPSNLGVYRTTATSTTDTARRIQQLNVSGLNINLGAGTYWVVWGATGSVASGPWQPYVSSATALPGGNAVQLTTAWATLADGTAGASLPFLIEGTSIPEPGTLSVLALGAVIGMIRRRK